ncbi:MAG TPA: thioredoxin domain-containing protein, partial [Chitinophagaceae bacterium]|nr:thioredoxin domain-containing protein [Chitinophagaceae bacterium]
MHKFSNKLINESSPYLLQHAHNPVNWYPWGKEALNAAVKENKPILVSIGYSACHWCHVMEKESFENETTAKFMNENFINIKIDREERPDLDHIYMDAVQAMTGSGGWPLNVFLTPDTKPFYGGTYFPPVKAYNRPSWIDLLMNVKNIFVEKRNEIEAQAENLTAHLLKSNSFGVGQTGTNDLFSTKKLLEVYQHIMKPADRQWGGFGNAPKFPQTMVIQFLLRYYYSYSEKEALDQALLSLDKMIDGGIYDQLGGGFARYSTDAEWLVPHFEKMLYDNALLLSVISEAYQLTRKEKYKIIIDETVRFIEREMSHSGGGFYSALDADSEGTEGKFYVWTYNEVKEILQEETDIFCTFFNIIPGGNWSEGAASKAHTNILWRKNSEKKFCENNNITLEELEEILQNGREKLLSVRNKRIKPQVDDKILLSWNCLMNTALSKAFAATGNQRYRELAIKNMDFLLAAFSAPETNNFFHSWKNGRANHPAFLDDYAYLIQSLIHLQMVTTETNYLIKAKEITGLVLQNFKEEDTGFFFYTSFHQKDILLRKKEVYDGA